MPSILDHEVLVIELFAVAYVGRVAPLYKAAHMLLPKYSLIG